jgi:hypothetical protein
LLDTVSGTVVWVVATGSGTSTVMNLFARNTSSDQTYQLTDNPANTFIQLIAANDWVTGWHQYDSAQTTFNSYVATLPEPGTVGLLGLTAFNWLRRGKRRATKSA